MDGIGDEEAMVERKARYAWSSALGMDDVKQNRVAVRGSRKVGKRKKKGMNLFLGTHECLKKVCLFVCLHGNTPDGGGE